MVADASGAPRRTQQERRDEAEKELLSAARALIAEQGVEKTSLAQIGERAGYSRGLVNYHFRTKDAMVERLVEDSHRLFTSKLNQDSAENGLETLLNRIESYIKLFEMPEKSLPAYLVMWGASFPSTANREAIYQAEERTRSILTATLKEGKKDGSIAADVDVNTAGFLIAGMMRGIAGEMLLSPNAYKAKRLHAELRKYVHSFLANDNH